MVDASFFPEDLESISEFWILVIGKRMLGRARFVARVSTDLKSAFVAELCRDL